MKFAKYFILSILSVLIVSCGKDDEPELEKSAEDLIYTSWKGVNRGWNYKGDEVTDNVILQFLSKSKGQYIILDDAGIPIPQSGEIWYTFDGPVIGFDGSLTGKWTIVKRTKNHLKLASFDPYESEMELERIF